MSSVADDAFPDGLLNPLFFDQRTTPGLSDFDVRQNFVFNLTWELPTPRARRKLKDWAPGGWQLGPTDNLTVFDQAGNPIPSAGLTTSTQTPAREVQFAIKVIWSDLKILCACSAG